MTIDNWVDATMFKPKEKQAVHIYMKYGAELFNIITGHYEDDLWFVYDIFTKKIRPFADQRFVTHWKEIDLPQQVKLLMPSTARRLDLANLKRLPNMPR